MIHALLHFESQTDPALAALVLYTFLLGGVGGFALARLPRRLRGTEGAARLPEPPPPLPTQIVVPDHVPDEWDVATNSN